MLTQSVESYIAVRRATGFAFRSEGSLLQSFAAFSDAAGKRYVSAETAIEWAGSAPSLCQRARRLGQVIRFARYIRAEGADILPRSNNDCNGEFAGPRVQQVRFLRSCGAPQNTGLDATFRYADLSGVGAGLLGLTLN